MLARQKLLAAVTASGAVLFLSVAADGRSADQQGPAPHPFPDLLSLRVEQLREKLRASVPADDARAAGVKLDNIVQFFNFNNSNPNCMQRGWKNC